MKRLVTLAACLAMLTFSGCAGGICGGLFSGVGNSGCGSPGLLGGSSGGLCGPNGLFSDGPVRQFLRGDACDTCNAAAGQVSPGFGATQSFGAATCDACGGIAPDNSFAPSGSFAPGGSFPGAIAPSSDPFAIPSGNPGNFGVQPSTSFYPSDAGVSLGQPQLQQQGIAPIDPGSIVGAESFGPFDGLSEPPGIIQ